MHEGKSIFSWIMHSLHMHALCYGGTITCIRPRPAGVSFHDDIFHGHRTRKALISRHVKKG